MPTGNHSRNDNPSLSGSEEPAPKRPRESPHHVIKKEYDSSEEHFTSERENYGGNHHFKTEQSDSYDDGGLYQDYHGQVRGSHHYEETVSPPPEERVLPSNRGPAPSMDLLKALNKKSSLPSVPQSLLHKSQPLYPERPARPTGYPRHLPRHFEESHDEYDDGYTFRGRDESRWKGEGYDFGPDNEYDDYGQDYDGYGYGERQGDSYHQEEAEHGENDYGFYDDGSYDDRPSQNYGGRSSYGDEPRLLPPKSSRYPQGLRGEVHHQLRQHFSVPQGEVHHHPLQHYLVAQEALKDLGKVSPIKDKVPMSHSHFFQSLRTGCTKVISTKPNLNQK